MLVSAYTISLVEELNFPFLFILIAEIILAIIFANRYTRSQVAFSRILIGLLFVFSGIVKGVDPVGTEYRIADYFIAYGTEWAFPLALPLSVFLNAVEFVLGALLIFNIRIKTTSWLVLFMMIVFTLTTINDAINNPVPDCGCFGDAILLSNWQTLYKNLVINALLILVFLSRSKIDPYFRWKIELALAGLFIFIFVRFEVHNIRHLPLVDFRDWKEGKRMANETPLPLDYYLTYRNNETGDEKEYLSPDYPYNDSLWMSKWEFISQRVVDPNPRIHDLSIQDIDGNDYTSQIIENPDFQFMLIAYDLEKTNLKKLDNIKAFADQCNNNGISFIVLTSSLPEEVESFKHESGLEADFYFADDVTQMAMIRSNPGLLLLKDAVVLKKWHHNDFPLFEESFVEN